MQQTQTDTGGTPSARESLGQCRRCLAAKLDQLEDLAAGQLSGVAGSPEELARRTRILVAEIDETLSVHIADEERDVFPTVLVAAESPARRAQAFEFVSSLLVEHREIAELWHALRIALLAAGGGVQVALPGGTAAEFLVRTRAHLEREAGELADLMAMIDASQSRDIAASIAKRHEQSCPSITGCPKKR